MRRPGTLGDSAAIAARPSAKSIFQNSWQRRSVVPEWIWNVLRFCALAAWLGTAAILILRPDIGLRLLWGLTVPLVPALLVIGPGLWRQVCPMALLNQVPARLGMSLGLKLPARLERRAFAVAFFVFVFVITLRAPIFNRIGWATGALLLGSLLAALVGGLVFQARSGWCGTFCPLGPIQRVYGQAPVVPVPQTYCKVCVGCEKNCYDFAPEAAAFDDTYDESPRYAGERRLFAAMLPGLLLGYFLVPYHPGEGYAFHAAGMLGAALASAGVYQFLTSFLPVNPYRAVAAFAAAAIIIFYFFSGPVMLATVYGLLHRGAPPALALWAARAIGPVCALALLRSGLRNEKRYQRAWFEAREAAAAGRKRTHWVNVENSDDPQRVEHNQTLLSALAQADCGISGQCEAGQCGSDPVEITEGLDNLTPAGDVERGTLARMGFGPSVRLACCARVLGPVSLRPVSAGAPADRAAPVGRRGQLPPERLAFATMRRARRIPQMRNAGDQSLRIVQRVLVIGGGVAGATLVEELRKASVGVDIAMIASEPRAPYRRIAIGQVAASKASPESLALHAADWHVQRRIEQSLGTHALAIDRAARQVLLSDGSTLSYDKLVLATGSRPRLPVRDFLSRQNTFVLHDLEDALNIRRFLQTARPRSAVVIGGGILAVEVAEMLAGQGVQTTIACRSNRLLSGNIDVECASLLHRYLVRLGIRLMYGAVISSWRGGDNLQAADLIDGGALEADLFVACTGVQPNVELAQGAGLAIGRGVIVDASMVTSDPDILAIGDVAERWGKPGGLWATAIAGAGTAVASIMGNPVDHMPERVLTKLKSAGLDLGYMGTMEERTGDDVIVAPPFQPAWWRIIIRKGAIVGANHAGPTGSGSAFWSVVNGASIGDAEIALLRKGDLETLV